MNSVQSILVKDAVDFGTRVLENTCKHDVKLTPKVPSVSPLTAFIAGWSVGKLCSPGVDPKGGAILGMIALAGSTLVSLGCNIYNGVKLGGYAKDLYIANKNLKALEKIETVDPTVEKTKEIYKNSQTVLSKLLKDKIWAFSFNVLITVGLISLTVALILFLTINPHLVIIGLVSAGAACVLIGGIGFATKYAWSWKKEKEACQKIADSISTLYRDNAVDKRIELQQTQEIDEAEAQRRARDEYYRQQALLQQNHPMHHRPAPYPVHLLYPHPALDYPV